MEIKRLADSGNCYHVTDGKTQLLIDCGIPIKRIREYLDNGLFYVEACLLSHASPDYSQGINEVTDAGLRVYATPDTWNTLREKVPISPYHFCIKPSHCYTIGTWSIHPFDLAAKVWVPGAVGFVCDTPGERLVYLSGCPYCLLRFDRITHLMIETIDMDDTDQQYGVFAFLKTHDLQWLRYIRLLHFDESQEIHRSVKAKVEECAGKRVKVL